MKKALILLPALLLCLGLCACREPETPPPVETPPEQTVTPEPPKAKEFALGYDPAAGLHPIKDSAQVNSLLTPLVYEGLYAVDETFTPHAVLAAEAAVDETGLIWTVTPVENAVFSDGTPLTASHVTASLNAARRSERYGERLSCIVSVRTSRGRTVITLSEPNGALPALLDIPIVLEQEDGPPLGTGRYRYVLTEEAACLVTESAGLPYSTIRLVSVADTEARIAAFDSLQVSMAIHDYFSPYAPGYSCLCEAWDYPTTDLVYVGFKASDGPCESPLVRRAFSCAFDREGMITALLEQHGTPSSLPIFPHHGEWSADAAALLNTDAETAAALLTEAGYTKKDDGLLYKGRSKSPLSVTLLVHSGSAVKVDAAQTLADALTQLGVTVTVNSLPWSGYTAALTKGQFDLYIGETRLTCDFDPTPLLSGGLNYGDYDPEPLAEPLSLWRASLGSERAEAARSFWQAFAAETPFAPLYFSHEAVLTHWNSVSNLSPIRSDPFLRMEDWILG